MDASPPPPVKRTLDVCLSITWPVLAPNLLPGVSSHPTDLTVNYPHSPLDSGNWDTPKLWFPGASLVWITTNSQEWCPK